MEKNLAIKIFITATAIALVSVFLASKIIMLDSLFLSLLLGIILSPKIRERDVAEKLVWYVLPISIALYGVNMRYVIPIENIIYPILSFITIFLVTYMLMRKFGFGIKERIIASTGSSVCGISAIVIISPIIGAGRKEVGRGILNLIVMGIVLYLIFTAIGALGNLAKNVYAILVGSVLPMVCFVTVAGMHQGVAEVALGVKGIRMDLILILALVLSIIFYKGFARIPWFILGFIFFSLISVFLQNNIIVILKMISKFTFSLSLALIGLSLEIEDLYLERNLHYIASMFIAFILSTAMLIILLEVLR